MTQTPPPTALNGSRLIRLLSDLAVAEDEASPEHFAERLGRLIDLPGSIALASVHSKLSTTAKPGLGAGTGSSSESAMEEVLRARMAIMQSIVNSFAPDAGISWSSLPRVNAHTPAKEAASYEHYQVFYVNQQKEIAFKVDKLKVSIRVAVSARSARLARLAALDATLDQTLSASAQQLFAEVPRLLGNRFQYLRQRHQQAIAAQQCEDDLLSWSAPGGWLEQFTGEMRWVLLAELEARLQPVLGLMEALDEEVEKS